MNLRKGACAYHQLLATTWGVHPLRNHSCT